MGIEIVDLPINNGGSFHSYVNVYQRKFICGAHLDACPMCIHVPETVTPPNHCHLVLDSEPDDLEKGPWNQKALKKYSAVCSPPRCPLKIALKTNAWQWEILSSWEKHGTFWVFSAERNISTAMAQGCHGAQRVCRFVHPRRQWRMKMCDGQSSGDIRWYNIITHNYVRWYRYTATDNQPFLLSSSFMLEFPSWPLQLRYVSWLVEPSTSWGGGSPTRRCPTSCGDPGP
jgi:hypothetical protein